MNTVLTPTRRAEREEMAAVVRAAVARGLAARDSLDEQRRYSIAASGVIIETMTQCRVEKVAIAESSPAEVDWAEGNLEPLHTVVRGAQDPGKQTVRISQDSNGRWWRFGGEIDLHHVDGRYVFVITLYEGANWDDYERLQMVIDAAKRGAFLSAGWCRSTDPHGKDAYAYRCGRLYADAGEANVFETTADHSPEVIACGDDRCTRLVHEAFTDTHVADEIIGNRWAVSVERHVDREGEDDTYEVNVQVSDALTAGELADLMADLTRMQDACRRANVRVAA